MEIHAWWQLVCHDDKGSKQEAKQRNTTRTLGANSEGVRSNKAQCRNSASSTRLPTWFTGQKDVATLQPVYSLDEWQYSRSFATKLSSTYCNALLFCGRLHCLSTGHHTWGLPANQRGIEPPPVVCRRQRRPTNYSTGTPTYCNALQVLQERWHPVMSWTVLQFVSLTNLLFERYTAYDSSGTVAIAKTL